jgi:hypothetical protein
MGSKKGRVQDLWISLYLDSQSLSVFSSFLTGSVLG